MEVEADFLVEVEVDFLVEGEAEQEAGAGDGVVAEEEVEEVEVEGIGDFVAVLILDNIKFHGECTRIQIGLVDVLKFFGR